MDNTQPPKDSGLKKLLQALADLKTNLDKLEEELLKLKQALEKLRGIKNSPN